MVEAGGAKRLKCPKCANVVTVAPGQQPECSVCGFGRTGGTAPVANPASTDAPAPAAYGTEGPPGKVRNPALVAFLALITLGIYGLVWMYLVFKETDRHSGQEHGTVLYVLGLVLSFVLGGVGGILLLVYMATEMGKLQRAKLQRGLSGGMGAGGYIGMVLGVMVVAVIVFIAMLMGSLAANFAALEAGDGAAVASFLGALMLSLLVLLVISLIPYVIVQMQINNYWNGVTSGAQPHSAHGMPA